MKKRNIMQWDLLRRQYGYERDKNSYDIPREQGITYIPPTPINWENAMIYSTNN
jgi:hypothetical protein